MFQDSVEVSEPLSTMVQDLPDARARTIFQNIAVSGRDKPVLLNQLKDVVAKSSALEQMVRPTCRVLDTAVSDPSSKNRLLVVEVMQVLTARLKEIQKLGTHAGRIFPSLLLLTFDGDHQVSDSARGVFSGFFPEAEKQNMFISKLRKELGDRLRDLVGELMKEDWDFGLAEAIENWGRMCGCLLAMTCGLVYAANGAKEIFVSVGEIPVVRWMKVTGGRFEPRMAAQARSYAYIYMLHTLQLKDFTSPTARDLLDYLAAETALTGQERLLRVLLAILQKNAVPNLRVGDLRQVLLKKLRNFYDPERVKLGPFLAAIQADPPYLQECIEIAIQMNDLEAAGKLFDVFYLAADRKLAPDFMLRLFRDAISRSPSSRFLGCCPLDYFLSLQDLPEIAELIEQGKDHRVYDFLRKCADDRSQRWLRQRTTISVETLNDVIQHEGTVPIRAAWESVANIPIVVDESKLDVLLLFVQQFIHSDEVPFVVEKWPSILPSLLSSWSSDFACFRPAFEANFEGMVTDLLNQDVGLARVLLRVFPDDERLTQLIARKVRSRLDEDGILLTDVFDYFRPPNELLDHIILSDAIEAVEPDDSLVPMIERRIPELVETTDPLALAEATVTFVRCAKRDPILDAISPLDAPLYCYEYWSRLGFSEMNDVDFCFLLNSYLEKQFPWLSSLIYLRQANWKEIPETLVKRIKASDHVFQVAQDNQLFLAIACIAAVRSLDFSVLSQLNGVTIAAMSTIQPPVSAIDLDWLSRVIACEWNQAIPELPDFLRGGLLEFKLRSSIAYLQHFLPVIEDPFYFVGVAREGIEGDEPYSFFLGLRVLALLADVNRPFAVSDILVSMIQQIGKFGKLSAPIEAEFSHAFSIGRFLELREFDLLMISMAVHVNEFGNSLIASSLVKLLAFFNAWELVEHRFRSRLDLSRIGPWHLITRAIAEMPFQKRLDILPAFTQYLPQMLTALSLDDPSFVMLISAFPSAAMQWYTDLSPTGSQKLMAALRGGQTPTDRVFAAMADSAAKLKLESTKISVSRHDRQITAVYLQDEASNPVKLTLKFPPRYPFCQVNVVCEFGSEGQRCEYEVVGAIIKSQSVEGGIIRWHQFVTQRLVDGEPCPVCYSYISEDMKKPTITCPTCGQKFHGKCLSKWFSNCLKPTCPYCATAWEQKKRPPSH